MYTICSFTAYLSCGFCKLMGTMKGKTVRYLGYAEPVKTTQGVGAGQEYQMGDTPGARGRIMTSQEIKAQAVAAEYFKARGFEPPPGNRFKGHSPLMRLLYWVEPKRLWVVPFCHAFYLGVVKDFLQLVFSKKTRKATVGLSVSYTVAAQLCCPLMCHGHYNCCKPAAEQRHC